MQNPISLIFLLLKQGYNPSQIPVFLSWRSALKGCQSVLDVGCGKSTVLKWLGVAKSVGIDGYEPDLQEAAKLGAHERLVLGDVRKLDEYFKAGETFDAAVAFDVIEHLPKEEAYRMVAAMEKMARRKIIIYTPNGFLPQRQAHNTDLQAHFSGWNVKEMQAMGYKVSGSLGPKFLRGEYHAIKFRPVWLWSIVSLFGQLVWTRWQPSKAAAILCVKTKPAG